MHEKQVLPVVVLGLIAALVSVVSLWTLERADAPSAGVAASVATGEVIEWKLVTTWPKGLPGLGAAPENFARRVNEASGGRLRIKVFGAGEIVPAFEVFDAVSRGVAEAGHGASYYWKGKIPASVFYTAVPFGMTAQEANGWLHYGGGLELWRELYAPFGVVPFAGGSTGVQMAGWFNIRLNSRADLDGLKMRIPGLSGEVFVYGRRVNDFHTVDYEALNTLNISATQELYRIIQAQKEQIEMLKKENDSLKASVENNSAELELIKMTLNLADHK